MKLTVTVLTCDLCKARHQHRDEADPADWMTAAFPFNGDPLNVAAICPSCVVTLLDPPEDHSAEIHRFTRETRLA